MGVEAGRETGKAGPPKEGLEEGWDVEERMWMSVDCSSHQLRIVRFAMVAVCVHDILEKRLSP